MKRILLAIAILLALVTVSPAQSEPAITATVPFGFHVGNSRVPAGDYRVSYYGTSDILVLVNAEERAVLAVQGYPAKQGDANAVPTLVFHKYGNTCFLAGVNMPGGRMHALPQSRREREFMNHAAPEQTIVAAVPAKR